MPENISVEMPEPPAWVARHPASLWAWENKLSWRANACQVMDNEPGAALWRESLQQEAQRLYQYAHTLRASVATLADITKIVQAHQGILLDDLTPYGSVTPTNLVVQIVGTDHQLVDCYAQDEQTAHDLREQWRSRKK